MPHRRRPSSLVPVHAATALLAAAVGMLPPTGRPASAQPRSSAAAEPRDGRTVDWYLHNPYARMGVLDQCTNDPGRLRDHPDCVNAQRADLADAARRLGPPSGFPTGAAFYTANPEIRASVLSRCRRLSAEVQRAYGECAPARQSIIDEQMRLTGRLPPEVRVTPK